MDTNAFTKANVETAMCLWEAAMGLRARLPALDAQWEAEGTVAMRHNIMSLVPACEAAWIAARAAGTEQDPYDWEHCPAFLIERYGPIISNYFYYAAYCSPDGDARDWSIMVRAVDCSEALRLGRELLEAARPGATKIDAAVTLDRDQSI